MEVKGTKTAIRETVREMRETLRFLEQALRDDDLAALHTEACNVNGVAAIILEQVEEREKMP